MKIKNSDSGSDVSSDSSWTVIEEITTQHDEIPSPKNDGIDMELIRTTEVLKISNNKKSETEFVKVTFSQSSIPKVESSENIDQERKEDGFLTFDEYLQERMLEHDYEYPSQKILKKKTKKFKGRRKYKAETVGVLSLCASLLTVTGVALLCLVFPESIDQKNFETIKSNYQTIVNNDSLDYNNIASNFNRTMEVLNAVNSSKILAKCSESFMKNSVPNRKPMGPINEEIKSIRKNRLSKPNIFQRSDMCYSKEKNVCLLNENPRVSKVKLSESKSPSRNQKIEKIKALSVVQNVLENSNLRSVIKSIIHDICFLKLITYLNKNNKSEDKKRKSYKGEKKATKRKIFEAISDGLINLEKNKTKTKKEKRIKSKKDAKNQNQEKSPSTSVVVQEDKKPSSSEFSSVKGYFVDGRSECERRFDELDQHRKKSKEFDTKARKKIQQIRQKYRNSVESINAENNEPLVKLHKLQTVRENYRLQLKKNREKYLKELLKMKKNRDKMLKSLCFRKVFEPEMKDSSVGNYVVPINTNFQSNLFKFKQNETCPAVFQIQNTKTALLPKTPSLFRPTTENSNQKNEFLQTKPGQSQMKLKKFSKRPATDIPSVFGLTFNFEKKNKSSTELSIVDKPESFENVVEKIDERSEGSDDENSRDTQLNRFQKILERNAELYKRSNYLKWKQLKNEQKEKSKKVLTKQDPQKTYKPNILAHKF